MLVDHPISNNLVTLQTMLLSPSVYIDIGQIDQARSEILTEVFH